MKNRLAHAYYGNTTNLGRAEEKLRAAYPNHARNDLSADRNDEARNTIKSEAKLNGRQLSAVKNERCSGGPPSSDPIIVEALKPLDWFFSWKGAGGLAAVALGGLAACQWKNWRLRHPIRNSVLQHASRILASSSPFAHRPESAALLNLRGGVRQSVIVKGPHGVGKTTWLAHEVLTSLYPWWMRPSTPSGGVWFTGNSSAPNFLCLAWRHDGSSVGWQIDGCCAAEASGAAYPSVSVAVLGS
uniref:Uncharacterized protein n=1 Tax=Chromera velia CCMP2878 TaxID=1169474 RepID=A0A0G4HAY5_9ALVE|eukprot:Cvel_6156.t1-p1 / transcript=Cvel_6156.t1 / gene=Cvel_6156 / organism=Chromera_velia_CCMP2878 / gene_product=hypothetical protein / transcript_product=hypothetical protein / location=Cvel_scaffold297:97810-99843(+) / protein_length=242 / sequence_SO=supercontig / SO=protein_coding / is_pseudo=false